MRKCWLSASLILKKHLTVSIRNWCGIYCMPKESLKVILQSWRHSMRDHIAASKQPPVQHHFSLSTSGVWQGSVLPSFLFLAALDYVMRDATISPDFSIKWSNGHLTDLDFRDDIMLLAADYETMQCMTKVARMCRKNRTEWYVQNWVWWLDSNIPGLTGSTTDD